MPTPIELQLDQEHFVLRVEGWECSLNFQRKGQTVSFDSVRVPDAVSGQGIAGQLTRYALDWARESELKVIPRCPYVASWIKRHPDYADLVA